MTDLLWYCRHHRRRPGDVVIMLYLSKIFLQLQLVSHVNYKTSIDLTSKLYCDMNSEIHMNTTSTSCLSSQYYLNVYKHFNFVIH